MEAGRMTLQRLKRKWEVWFRFLREKPTLERGEQRFGVAFQWAGHSWVIHAFAARSVD